MSCEISNGFWDEMNVRSIYIQLLALNEMNVVFLYIHIIILNTYIVILHLIKINYVYD